MFKGPHLIAETAYNHEGDFSYLENMVKALGPFADTVKFHLLSDIDDYMLKTHPLYNDLRKWMFSDEQWKDIFELSKSRGFGVVALCDDPKSIGLANSSDAVVALELHASAMNDLFMLEACGESDKAIVLGIGGCSEKEIDFALDILRRKGKRDEEILLMYGFQSFPTDYANIRFGRLLYLMQRFKGLSFGYADHTPFDDPLNPYISALPVSFGVGVIEKHFTLDKGENRIDYQSAVSVDDLKQVKDLMLAFDRIWSNGSVVQTGPEKAYGQCGPSRKALVFNASLKKGDVIEREHLAYKRTPDNSPLQQSDIVKILGRRVARDIDCGELVVFDVVE